MNNKSADRPIVVRCPHCGKQNLIAPERFKLIDLSPVKCWVCQREIPKEIIVRAVSS